LAQNVFQKGANAKHYRDIAGANFVRDANAKEIKWPKLPLVEEFSTSLGFTTIKVEGYKVTGL